MLEKSLLWKLQGKDNHVSYLFGTMHIKNDVSYSHTEKAVKAMQTCEAFCAEINLTEAASEMTPDHYFVPNNKKVSDFLSASKFEKIRKTLFKGFDFDLEYYNRLLPIIITNKLTEIILRSEVGKSLDAFLWSEAERIKLQMGGLETMKEQLDILKSLEMKSQIKMLKDLAKDVSKFRKSVLSIEKLYANQDIKLIHKATRKSLGSLRKVLLYDRNELMSARIIQNLENSTFYAIGAAHLAGNKGVLSCLKRGGVTVKPII